MLNKKSYKLNLFLIHLCLLLLQKHSTPFTGLPVAGYLTWCVNCTASKL